MGELRTERRALMNLLFGGANSKRCPLASRPDVGAAAAGRPTTRPLVRGQTNRLGRRLRPHEPWRGTPSRKENGAAPAKDGPGKLGSNCQTVPAYAELIVEVTVLKVALICEPSPRAAAMMPTAIKAAIRPYSMAVAPDSSFTKRMTWFCMMLSQGLGRLFPCPDAGYGTVVCESLTGSENLTEW